MSLYQLHRCIWDKVRAGQVSGSTSRAFDLDSYELTDEERAAVESSDVATLYRMGLHPVLLNGYCRSEGFSRNDYRQILQQFAEPEERKAPWQR